MKTYTTPTGRTIKRDEKGRFARTSLRDLIGTAANKREMICGDCGYKWTPLVVSDKCFQCNSVNVDFTPPPEITPEVESRIARYKEIRPNGFLNPRHVDEAIAIERELRIWIEAGEIRL